MPIIQQEEEEYERKRLSVTKVIEYLEPVMSRELLCKFPDNSAFDFDYSQSSLWSPLVPRAYSPMDLDLVTPRKLSYEFSFIELGSKKKSIKKVTPIIKKKIKTAVCNIDLNVLKMKRMKNRAGFEHQLSSSTPVKTTCVPITTKGWNKVLKAASKHFKRKKKEPTAHVKLSSYLNLTDSNF